MLNVAVLMCLQIISINIQLCDGIRKMFIWNECVRVVICWALTLSSSFPIAMQIHPILIKFSISYWSEIPLAGWFMSNGHDAVLRWIRWFVYICNRTPEYFVQTKKNVLQHSSDTFWHFWDSKLGCSHSFIRLSQWKLLTLILPVEIIELDTYVYYRMCYKVHTVWTTLRE